MAEHPNETLIRRAYKDFEAGDIDLVRVVMADEAVWHEPGRSSLAGDYKGPAEILGFLDRLRTESAGTFRAEIVELLADSERAVVFQRETATRGTDTLDVVACVDFEIHHGKITEVTVYQADTHRFDEFWG
jgi:ketosteroid isomerase-like protein